MAPVELRHVAVEPARCDPEWRRIGDGHRAHDNLGVAPGAVSA
jgi:hypothetical protein